VSPATARTIPASWYVDRDVLDREQELVLAPGWSYVGDAQPVAETGTFLAASLGQIPIVVTRDGDGELRALANVCRHRGAVVAEGCGRRATLQCPYHGWTYRLDGTLHRAPGMEAPEGTRLPRLSVETVGPLLFACADPDANPLAPQLSPFLELVQDIAGIDVSAVGRRRRIEHVIDANWKAVVENFIECYHCPLVHATTLPGFGGDDYLVELHGRLQTQLLDDARFSFAFLYPNTLVSAYGDGGAIVARALAPAGPSRTTVALDYWFEPRVPEAEADEWIAWFESVIAEDVPLCESVQTGYESRAIDRGLLHPLREAGLAHFHRLLREDLGADILAAPSD
jgi:choline monooxygenase